MTTRHNRQRVQQHRQPNGRFIVDLILVAAFIAVLAWLLFFVLPAA
jgi:hypothetical protein